MNARNKGLIRNYFSTSISRLMFQIYHLREIIILASEIEENKTVTLQYP